VDLSAVDSCPPGASIVRSTLVVMSVSVPAAAAVDVNDCSFTSSGVCIV
jgi:hypothetical protein